MQTFLPYPDFAASARCLDYKRLGKQRVECAQILNAMGRGGGWASHPATRMWRGFEPALRQYQREMILEWVARGYNNSMAIAPFQHWGEMAIPPWLGNPDFHASHRSNLLRKDPGYYSQFGWTEPDNLAYIWPCD